VPVTPPSLNLALLLSDSDEFVAHKGVREGKIRSLVKIPGLLPLKGCQEDRFPAFHQIKNLHASHQSMRIISDHRIENLLLEIPEIL